MSGRVHRFAVSLGSILRDIGSATRGFMPPLRSSDGTFGTQRQQGAERAAQRRRDYPGD